ncbi:MAG: hypothetical protein N3E47_06065 [Candidatus Bathyarchaeota archaeon]|nr:hypothetical protein [Candidatus Bathyarchaeota archaeon]
MKIEEKRIIALLILLLGLTMLAAGILTNQINYLLDFIRKIFEPSIAGAP